MLRNRKVLLHSSHFLFFVCLARNHKTLAHRKRHTRKQKGDRLFPLKCHWSHLNESLKTHSKTFRLERKEFIISFLYKDSFICWSVVNLNFDTFFFFFIIISFSKREREMTVCRWKKKRQANGRHRERPQEHTHMVTGHFRRETFPTPLINEKLLKTKDGHHWFFSFCLCSDKI